MEEIGNTESGSRIGKEEKKTRDILNASQAAKVIGCNSQKVRVRLKRNIWTFGTVIYAKESGNKVDSYEINKGSLARFLGIDMEEIDRRLQEKRG